MSKIKDLPEDKRPREKLEKYGPASLTDAELLSVLLRAGYTGKNVKTLSSYLLSRFSIKELFDLRFEELVNLKGIGKGKAATLKASFELCRRGADNADHNITIENSKDAFQQLVEFRNKKQEYLIALYLDARNQLINKSIITKGTINANLISPREVFAKALKTTAISIVLAHNHPSGDHVPSREDIEITNKLVQAGKTMDITIFDHIIISKNGFLSIREEKPEIFKP